jgi:hypothetical protein
MQIENVKVIMLIGLLQKCEYMNENIKMPGIRESLSILHLSQKFFYRNPFVPHDRKPVTIYENFNKML